MKLDKILSAFFVAGVFLVAFSAEGIADAFFPYGPHGEVAYKAEKHVYQISEWIIEDQHEDDRITEALEVQGYFRPNVPLSYELQDIIQTQCAKYGIPYHIILGQIEVESSFNVNALNSVSGCYGLMQINPTYHPAGLTPEENVVCGIGYLDSLIGRYGSLEAGLQAYHDGHDTGYRWYANAVLEAAQKWQS